MKTLVFAVATLLAASLSPAEESGPEPKHRLRVSGKDVLSTRTVDLGERRVTFERVRPLSLPPIPEAVHQEPDPAVMAALEAFAEEVRKRHYVFVSGTVYLRDDDPQGAKSLVRLWSNRQRQPVSMWINANMLWFGGFADYETEDADYSLMLLMSAISLDGMAEAARKAGVEWPDPQIPDFGEDDTGEIRIVEGDPTAAELEPIRSLMRLYRTDKARLEAAYAQRVAAAEARRLERLADPPEKKDIRVRYWRLDQPAEKEALIR
jgi:hypothetical protein